MKKLSFSRLLIVIGLLSACSDNRNFILDEHFDSNELGWYEESTFAHELKMQNGQYYLSSLDSLADRTSAGTFNDDYLTGLPSTYEIEMSLLHDPLESDSSYFGFLLESPSIEYEFQICPNGQIQVCEYDYNLRKSLRPFHSSSNINIESPIVLNVRIEEREFTVTVNGDPLGTGKFRCGTKAWKDLRLVTSSQTSTSIDYIRIQ